MAAQKRIPLFDPYGEVEALRAPIIEAIQRVMDGAMYILGPEVNAFEKTLAASVNVGDAVGVASGTDALALALQAVGVAPGDEVMTVSHTAGPTVAAIHMAGAVPVLVDVDLGTFCMSAEKVAAALSPRTSAIIAVHLYGHPADMDAIRAAAPGVALIEDCAQAQGATYRKKPVGGLGEAGCFSFYPTKNLGALGDGGAIVSSRANVVDRARRLRTYGWTKPQYAEIAGGRCSRLDELQAAILNVKLAALPAHISRRRAVAARYQAALKDLPLVLPSEAPHSEHAYHLYVIRSDRRDALEAHLQSEGVATGRHYPLPVHKQPAFAARARIPAPLVVTEQIGGEILSLPMFATMTENQQDQVIIAIRSFFA